MTAPTPTLQYATLTYGRYAVTADGLDANATPDLVGRNGRVIITPNVDPPRLQVGSGSSMLILDYLPIVLRLVNGVLLDDEGRTNPSVLVASAETNPSGWNLRVDFELEGDPKYAPAGFSFNATGGQVINLANVTPVAETAGVSITKGDKGDQGNAGIPGINWRGAWSSSTAYAIRDAVSHNGSSYYALAASTNVTPTPGATWALLAAAATTTLTDNSVTTPKIADGAVTEPKLATGGTSTRALADGAVTFVKLSFDPATQAELDTAIATRVANSVVGQPSGVATLDSNGKVPSGQLPASAGVPLYRYKVSDTSRASTVTLTADPDLSFPATFVLPGVYVIGGDLLATGSAGGDVQYGLGGTATYTHTVNFVGPDPSLSSTTPTVSSTNFSLASKSYGTVTSVPVSVRPMGIITVSVAGTLVLTWAQNTSSTTATVLNAGSFLSLVKIA